MNSKGTQLYIYTYPFSPKLPLLPSSRLPHNTEQSSLCYTGILVAIWRYIVGPCWLSMWIPGVQRRWPGPRASSFVLFWVWLQPHYKAALQTPSQTSPQFLQGTGRTDAGCKFPSSGCPEGNSWGSGKVSCFCYHPIRKCDKEKQTQACSPRW